MTSLGCVVACFVLLWVFPVHQSQPSRLEPTVDEDCHQDRNAPISETRPLATCPVRPAWWEDDFEKLILDKYPGYFRDKTQLVDLQKLTSVQTSTADVGVRGTTVYHACCTSKNTWSNPDYLFNAQWEWVQILQFQDNKQYFSEESCQQVQDCQCGCTCRTSTTFVNAVVVNNGDHELDMVRVENGTCRCYNEGS